MPKSAPADSNHSGPTNEDKLAAIREMKRLGRAKDEAQGVYRSTLKRFKAEGHNTVAILETIKAERRDPDEVAAEMKETLHLMALRQVITWDEMFKAADDQNVTQRARDDDDMWDADEKGYRAGRNGADRAENPYDAGSERADEWDRSWAKGQASIAAEMGPQGEQASAAKKRPARKAAAAAANGNGEHAEQPRRGRPKGARNKPKAAKAPVIAEPVEEAPSTLPH